MQTVGVVRRVARYPVKSMRGEDLPIAMLTLQGLEEDRRYAFVQRESRSSFPWLTAREFPEMLSYQTFVGGSGATEAVVKVKTPDGEWPVESKELQRTLEARSGRALFLMRDYRGCYDVAQVSVISRQTVAQIAEESGTEEEAWRFRPNLLIDLQEAVPFGEIKWVGRVLRVGDTARIAITETDQRCMIITLDPASAKASPSILRTVVQQHEKCAGVYGTVLTSGEVRPGDPIKLES